MIDLYSVPTANGQRVHIMLEETGLAYQPHFVDLQGGEHLGADFLSKNPLRILWVARRALWTQKVHMVSPSLCLKVTPFSTTWPKNPASFIPMTLRSELKFIRG